MSEMRGLVPAGRSDLAPVVGTNPLVARGLGDLLRPEASVRWEIDVEIPGSLMAWLWRLEAGCKWRSPGRLVIDLRDMMMSTGIREGIEEEISFRKERLEKLVSLKAPEVIIKNEQRFLDRAELLREAASKPDLWSFQFKSDARSARCTKPDEKLRGLCEFSELEVLDLAYCPVGDAGLSELKSLSRLFRLALNSESITDDGLRDLPSMIRLAQLELVGCSVTDRLLKRIAPLKQLELLNITACRITDDGLFHLRSFPNLRNLLVSKANAYYGSGRWAKTGRSNAITDDGLRHIAQLSALEELELVGCEVSDRGVAHLSILTALKSLDLMDTQVTGDCLKHFAGVVSLERLFLTDCPLTDEGLFNLREQSELSELHLGGTRITDMAIEHLSNLKQLDTLLLDHTAVTDQGLRSLRGLENLTDLSINFCPNVTRAGIETLKQELPKCKISHSCGS